MYMLLLLDIAVVTTGGTSCAPVSIVDVSAAEAIAQAHNDVATAANNAVRASDLFMFM